MDYLDDLSHLAIKLSTTVCYHWFNPKERYDFTNKIHKELGQIEQFFKNNNTDEKVN